MAGHSFQFTVGMLAELTGSNRQYLSRKIKRMIEDPEIRLQAVIRSNKEGYRIAEEEVLRCFDRVTPQQIADFKDQYDRAPRARMLTKEQEKQPSKYLEKENDLLVEWRIQYAASSAEEKQSETMREYLEKTLQELRTIQAEKQRESVLLEVFLAECERSVQKLETLLADWPQD